jgi:lysophospholipase L1-like esterase
MKPDLLSILIGTNDIGQGLRDPKRRITPASFESDYRFILDASRKANPELRLVLLDPFVLPTGGLKNEQAWKSRSEPTAVLREVVAKLATDYEAVHIRTQDIFDKAAKVTGPENLIWDGIHPLPAGHELIARHWIQAVSERWPKNRE